MNNSYTQNVSVGVYYEKLQPIIQTSSLKNGHFGEFFLADILSVDVEKMHFWAAARWVHPARSEPLLVLNHYLRV